jgi:hypothetical protein
MAGSRALACFAAVPAALAGLPPGYGVWALLPISGGSGEVGAYVGLGVLAALLGAPILCVLVPLLALGSDALLRRLGWRGVLAHLAFGGAAGAVAGPAIIAAVEGVDGSQRLLSGLPPGILAGLLAALAFWAVRRPDRA